MTMRAQIYREFRSQAEPVTSKQENPMTNSKKLFPRDKALFLQIVPSS